jgi:phosphoserine phosphatase
MRGPLLSLWNDGHTRRAILEFVERVTKIGTPDFVPDEERVAVFDNDGTLWCEKPMPVQAAFLVRRLGEQAAKEPELRDRQPWKAAWEKDNEWLSNAITKHYQGDDRDLHLMAAGLLGAHAGDTVETFALQAEQFLRASRNPLLRRPYFETTYAPMQELLRLLRANGFSIFIASGGGRDFVRTVALELYGVPPERVIGSSAALEYRSDGRGGDLYHLQRLDIFDDGPTKPVRIWERVGRRPLLAAGNSNGDLQMLEFTGKPGRPSLRLLVDHDDAAREAAYTAGAERVMEVAQARRWTVISMRHDWRAVFAEPR